MTGLGAVGGPNSVAYASGNVGQVAGCRLMRSETSGTSAPGSQACRPLSEEFVNAPNP